MKICKNDGKKFEDSYKFCPLCGGQLVAQTKEDVVMDAIKDLTKRIEALENRTTTGGHVKHELSEDYKIDLSKKMAKHIRDNDTAMSFKECFQAVTGRTPGGQDYEIKNLLKDEYGVKVNGLEKFQRCYILPSHRNKLKIDSNEVVIGQKKTRQYKFSSPEWPEKRKKMLQELSIIRKELKPQHPDWSYTKLCQEAGRIYKERQIVVPVSRDDNTVQGQLQQDLHKLSQNV